MQPSDRQRQNLRTGLILGSIALAFFIGFIVRMVFFGSH